MIVERSQYIERLKALKDTQLIKVITGIRRAGKSTLLSQYQDYLQTTGVQREQIVAVNFEDLDYSDLMDVKALYSFVKSRMVEGRKTYVFFDEIQQVPDFQKVVDSLYIKPNVDIYITGSNSRMLSGELSTLLSGRYVEMCVYPFSFAEYSEAFAEEGLSTERLFADYRGQGGFPYLSQVDKKLTRDYLSGLYSTVILKDVVARRGYTDTLMLESVVRFLYDNISNVLSTKKIADTMTSAGRKIDVKTVERYIQSLVDCYFVYRAKRYDVRDKQHLKTLEKYYAIDLGLRSFILGNKARDVGRELENVVYIELLRRGGDVYVGKVDNLEIDFIVMTQEGMEYYQVSETVRESSTLSRELAPFRQLSDSYPKYLLTMDMDPEGDYEGVRRINVIDWLLGKS